MSAWASASSDFRSKQVGSSGLVDLPRVSVLELGGALSWSTDHLSLEEITARHDVKRDLGIDVRVEQELGCRVADATVRPRSGTPPGKIM